MTWQEFREQYERDVLSKRAPGTKREAINAFTHFERLIKPKLLTSIKTSTIDRFSSLRITEDSKRNKGHSISPATVNKELRQLKAALRKARRWGYIATAPDFDFLREPEKLIEFIDTDQFTRLYEACESMKRPRDFRFTPAQWWRGVLCVGFLTGWRIGEILSLAWEDVDFEARTAITRWSNNKGRRDGIVDLHPVVVDHLRCLVGFHQLVFPWPHHKRTLWSDFEQLKRVAGANFSGAFHRLRDGFATLNQGMYELKVLQSMMRHKSSQTTQRYMNIETQVKRTAQNLFVPDVLKSASS